jgi:D-threo-aldose 1-dehydrogenase
MPSLYFALDLRNDPALIEEYERWHRPENILPTIVAGRPRHTFVVSTKVGRRIESDTQERPGFAVAGHRAVFDYSGDGVRRSMEASLERLGVSRIDILLLHYVGKLTHGERHPEILKQSLDEALPAMAALRDSGVVDALISTERS